jgi:hypothetical protein
MPHLFFRIAGNRLNWRTRMDVGGAKVIGLLLIQGLKPI